MRRPWRYQLPLPFHFTPLPQATGSTTASSAAIIQSTLSSLGDDDGRRPDRRLQSAEARCDHDSPRLKCGTSCRLRPGATCVFTRSSRWLFWRLLRLPCRLAHPCHSVRITWWVSNRSMPISARSNTPDKSQRSQSQDPAVGLAFASSRDRGAVRRDSAARAWVSRVPTIRSSDQAVTVVGEQTKVNPSGIERVLPAGVRAGAYSGIAIVGEHATSTTVTLMAQEQ